jgi:hypothetical protein
MPPERTPPPRVVAKILPLRGALTFTRNGQGDCRIRDPSSHPSPDTPATQVAPKLTALTTHKDVDDAKVLPDLVAQIPSDVLIGTVGGDARTTGKQCHAAIAAREDESSIPPLERAMPWSQNAPGASWRNESPRRSASGRADRRLSGVRRPGSDGRKPGPVKLRNVK